MKLTMPRDALASAAAWATATARAGNRPAAPALAGLLLTADEDGTVTAAGYDYEVSATAALAAETGEPGRALIPARLLTQAAASLPEAAEVTLTCDGTFATLAAGRVSYRLMLLPHEEFPALPEAGEQFAGFGADYLAAALAQAATAASTDDTLPALTCLHVSLDGGHPALAGKPAAGVATFAATDRYRLAVVTCPYTTAAETAPGALLIPARPLLAAVRKPAAATVTLAGAGNGTIALATPGRQVTIRHLPAEFPAYARLIPAEAEVSATVTAGLGELIPALKRAAVIAVKGMPVRLAASAGALHLQAGTGDDTLAEDITADTAGDPFPFGLSPRYLLDALTAIAASGARTARIALTRPARPVLIEPAAPPGPVACRHILMPVKSAG